MKRLCLLLLVLNISPGANAGSPEEGAGKAGPEKYGLAIAREYDARDLGFGDSTADMKMILVDSHGRMNTRLLHTKALEVEQNSEGERRLLVFDEPFDVKGTVMLTVTQKERPDDQWLYLPAVKRVKRIASNNKTGPFMGSEFAYEDMGSVEVGKYTYRHIEDRACAEGLECFVVERYPVDRDSGYSRQIVFIDKKEYRLWRVEFFDRKDELLKILTLGDYRQYLGKYWRASEMVMENVQTGKKTVLNWDNYRFQVGLDNSDFESSRLTRVR